MPLLEADRSLIAWEWLRRDPLYRAAAIEADGSGLYLAASADGPARFGLVAFEPPDLAVPSARPIWSLSVHPFVLLAARGERANSSDRFDVERFEQFGRLLVTDQSEHLLLSDGFRAIRLDGPARIFAGGPTDLAYSIHGLRAAEAPLMTLRRFLALARNGRFSRLLYPCEKRARRWMLLLRTADALADGACQREIAEVLLSSSAREPRWRSRDPNLRLKVQRLVHLARQMSNGGYRRLLG